MTIWYEALLENGLLPDVVVRAGIRGQLRARLRQQSGESGATAAGGFFDELSRGPIATDTGAANTQHYEVPTEFYRLVLGPHLKYSSGYWPAGVERLADAEETMLELYVQRAGIEDGQRILDLGCGWGSLSLYLARRFPAAEIVAVSNSAGQGEFIRSRAARDGLGNLEALRADVNDFAPRDHYDRVLSIEMFEHVSNYPALLARIAAWLAPQGRLFVHHFAHREHVYPFVSEAQNEWMAKHFFSGGIMPSADLLSRFDEDLQVIDRWEVNGRHYQRTCEAWLRRMSANRAAIDELFVSHYGRRAARRHYNYWRVFFMACAELFGYQDGEEWLVVHTLLSR